MSNESDQWNERYAGTDRLWIQDPDPQLVKSVSPLPVGTALDLGCGEGRNALWLAQAGWRVTAVDFSSVALERLARAAEERGVQVEVEEADLLEFSNSKRTFDLVVLANIHPPAESRRRLFAELPPMVNPGGHLFLIGHHVDAFGHSGPPERERLLTEEEVAESFSGYRIDRLERVEDIADHGGHGPSVVALITIP